METGEKIKTEKPDAEKCPVGLLAMPLQPIFNGRFIPNKIVMMLLDRAPVDLNGIACMDFTQGEREQFAQLIGYSISGFGELSYVSEETYTTAVKMTGGQSEIVARIEYLQETIDGVRTGLKSIIPTLFRIHPDDLEV